MESKLFKILKTNTDNDKIIRQSEKTSYYMRSNIYDTPIRIV